MSDLFCDIGNSTATFFDKERVFRIKPDRIREYAKKRVYFINVNPLLESELKEFDRWIDLEPFVNLPGAYEGLGIDRKVLSLAVEEGVVVDAGSAVTVDLMIRGSYGGGFIYPGRRSFFDAFRRISDRLGKAPLLDFDSEFLPKSTQEALGYGFVMPLVRAVESIAKGRPIYLTGGDAQIFERHFKNAICDEKLIFKGMEKVVKEIGC